MTNPRVSFTHNQISYMKKPNPFTFYGYKFTFTKAKIHEDGDFSASVKMGSNEFCSVFSDKSEFIARNSYCDRSGNSPKEAVTALAKALV